MVAIEATERARTKVARDLNGVRGLRGLACTADDIRFVQLPRTMLCVGEFDAECKRQRRARTGVTADIGIEGDNGYALCPRCFAAIQ